MLSQKATTTAENEVIKKNPHLWKKALKEAVPIYDYFINSAVGRYGVESAEGKRRVVNEVIPVLSKLTDEILRSHYLQQLSVKVGVEETDLRELVEKYVSSDQKGSEIKEVLDKPLSPRVGSIVEKYLLALVVQSGQIEKGVAPELFTDNSYQEIFKLIKQYKKENEKWRVKAFAKNLPEALLPAFDDILLFDIDEEVLELPSKLEQEINVCANRLKELSLRKKLKELSIAIKQAEAVGNGDKIRSLSEEFRDRSSELMSIEVK